MSTTKPMTAAGGPVATITLGAAVLPGIGRGRQWHVSIAGEGRHQEAGDAAAFDPDPATLAGALKDTANLRELLALLDQIGWQTQRSVSVTASTETLRRIF